MRKFLLSDSGMGLIDVLVALAIMATAATAFVAAIGTGAMATRDVKEDTIAQSLARSQLEYVKDLPFDADAISYPSIDTPDGYSISADVSSIPGADLNIQMVTITVSQSGETLLVVEEYKHNR
jgi:Tfp pilus assembly protein PilV